MSGRTRESARRPACSLALALLAGLGLLAALSLVGPAEVATRVSLASGIPTFRGSDPGAIWKRDPKELGTRAFFERDPVGSWRWFRCSPLAVPGPRSP